MSDLTKRWMAVVLAVSLPVAGACADTVSERIKTRIEGFFDDAKVTSIAPTPVEGLYEVMLGPSLLYVSADGRFVMHGDLFDLEQRVNISDEKRALARKRVFEALDPVKYIEFAANGGKARKTLYVFTDIDCTYCRRMHREVPELNKAGVTIRYLAFPRSGIGGASFKKATAVWCSEDRRKAMTEAKAGKDISAKSCDNPVAEEFELGKAMGVSGTPAVYTEDGRQIGGYVPAAEIIAMVRDGKI